MIVLEPEGGLGNRLRAIHSAVRLSKATGHNLIIQWVEKGGMMCQYKDLFSDSDKFQVKELQRTIFRRAINVIMAPTLSAFLKNIQYDLVLSNEDVQRMLNSNRNFENLIEDHKKIFIKTHHFFYEGCQGFFAPSPTQKITNRVQKLTQKYQKVTIGIHIRGTDNKKSKEMSPVSIFISRMKEIIQKSPKAIFYLSTDSMITRKSLITEFGEKKIIFQPDIDYSRDSRKGIVDAYVDMLCLSKTDYIIGSYWSSFSAVSASIGGIDKETLTINTG